MLAFLHSHASQVDADPDAGDLLIAYREWLDTAIELFSTGDEARIRDYMRRGAVLGAEMEMAEARLAEVQPS